MLLYIHNTHLHRHIYTFSNKNSLKKLISLCTEYIYSFLLTAALVILVILLVRPGNTGLCSVTGPPCHIKPLNNTGYLLHLGMEERVIKVPSHSYRL